MFIIGLGTATPPWRYTQAECWAACQGAEPVRQLSSRSQALLEKIFLGRNGIETRSLALPDLRRAFDLEPDTLHARFRTHAPRLATEAAQRALQSAGLRAADVDAILISTCTGYLCPGLTSYVAEQLDLRPDVLSLDLVGQGCGAAIPNLRAAEALLTSERCGRVLSICVEVCSAAFYLDDDPGVLVSACLFGDGAAAVVLSRRPGESSRRVEWKAATGLLNPSDRDYLKFEQSGGRLRNVLTRRVPVMAGKHAAKVLGDLLAQTGTRREQISTWILHPGGREVLSALQDRLGLAEIDLAWSAATLREFGNLSSAGILFTLSAALQGGASKGRWWLTTFGAGFSCHGALLDVA